MALIRHEPTANCEHAWYTLEGTTTNNTNGILNWNNEFINSAPKEAKTMVDQKTLDLLDKFRAAADELARHKKHLRDEAFLQHEDALVKDALADYIADETQEQAATDAFDEISGDDDGVEVEPEPETDFVFEPEPKPRPRRK